VTAHLPRSTPAAQATDAGGVLAFLDAMDRAPQIELHSLMVLRHGFVVAEGWWAPYRADRVHLLYSLSKSFTATAAGFTAAEGLLDLDDTVVSHFPEFDADITDPRSRAIKLRHVAAMASGHEQEMLERAREADPAEPVRGFLLLPPEREPGSVFAYNQPCTYSLAAVVQRRAEAPLTTYLRPRLFEPLGIGAVGWHADNRGRELGYSGLHARTEDVAKLGQLYLQGGVWDGRRLLPAKWVAEATRTQVANPDEPNPDWQQGYGFQFWMARHGYRGDGAYGQFCLVLPEQDAVVAITAGTTEMQAVLDGVWAELLPAFRPAGRATLGDGGRARDDELAARLAGLELTPLRVDPTVPGRPERWTERSFAVSEPGLLRSVRLVEGHSEWQLELDDGQDPVCVPLGTQGWAVAEDPVPVACSGGWLDGQTLRAEVILLETPHRFSVTCHLADRVADVVWRTEPLHLGPLRTLRSPAGSAVAVG
jgi:CubicO group peptidase (beta-lactamase class C family)